MAGIGSWYPRTFISALLPGAPAAGTIDVPLYDSTTKRFYCAWRSVGGSIDVRALLSPTTLYSRAGSSTSDILGECFFGGYLYFVGVNASNQLALFRVSTTTWTGAELATFDSTSPGTGTVSRLIFDGSDYIYIFTRTTVPIVARKIHKYSISGATDTVFTCSFNDIRFRGIVGSYIHVTSGGTKYTVAIADGALAIDSWDVFLNGFHTKLPSSKVLYNPAESWSGTLANNVEEDHLIILGNEATPKIIQFDHATPANVTYYEGDTVVLQNTASIGAFLWMNNVDQGLTFHQTPTIALRTASWRALGAEVT